MDILRPSRVLPRQGETMTDKQIESAEDHYDDYLRYSQECFGVSWTPGCPCNACDDKKECCEKYLLTHPIPKSLSLPPHSCEYQKHWETICREQSTTDPMVSKKYESYSCMLCFCRYPQRECEVKKK